MKNFKQFLNEGREWRPSETLKWDSKHPVGSKEHLDDLANRYAHHETKEHEYYLNRGDKRSDTLNKKHFAAMKHVNRLWKKHYGHLKDDSGERASNIGDYDTSDSDFSDYWSKQYQKNKK